MQLASKIALISARAPGIAIEVAESAQVEDHIVAEVSRLLEDVRSALSRDMSIARSSATRLAAFLASKVAHDVRPVPARGGLAPWQKRKVQSHIEAGLEGPLPVEELAKLVSLSASYFYRAFKESFGEPPHAYVVKMRVARARTLMLTTSETLSQIALACGLADQAHLCRCFRQVMGTTPGAWRRGHATEDRLADPIAVVDPVAFGSRRQPFQGDITATRRGVVLSG